MANCCEYKVIVKGKKNACYAFFGSMSCMDYKDIVSETGTDEDCILRFEGNCKWSVDSYCEPWNGTFPVDIPENYEEAYQLAENKFWYHTVEERSKMFEVEVFCNSADIEDYEDEPIEYFEHYISGVYQYCECPVELRIGSGDEDEEMDFFDEFPIIRSIEGTGYLGRNDRIEFLKVGDEVILKADYNSQFYSPVAIEVFNTEGETLGFLKESYFDYALEELAEHISEISGRVASVTPLSKRTKRAKYALLDIELYKK